MLAHKSGRWDDAMKAALFLVGGRTSLVLWASGVSESRHGGAAGHTTWTPVVGLADETSARRAFCGISLVRSSRHQLFATECPGGDDLPQGWGRICCVRTLEIVKYWMKLKRGVKIILAQI